jgi:hypothetical protein
MLCAFAQCLKYALVKLCANAHDYKKDDLFSLIRINLDIFEYEKG